MTWIRLVALLLVVLATGSPAASPPSGGSIEGELRRGFIELSGPLESPLFFELSSRDVLRLDLPLRAGESRRFELLLPRAGGLEPISLSEEQPGVRFTAFESLQSSLPPGLRTRTARPPVTALAGGSTAGASRPLVAWIGFSGVLLLALILIQRGRQGTSLALSAAAALALALVGGGERPEPAALRVEEGQAGETFRLAVDSGFERLSFPAGATGAFRLNVRPATRPVLWTLTETSGGEARLELEAPGARIDLSSVPEEAGTEGAEPKLDENSGPAYAEAWTRDRRGSWRAHGPWPEGQPLPLGPEGPKKGRAAAGEGAQALPTWLVTGLPQGRTVLLLREQPREEEGRAVRWHRWTGLELH